jgi:hypothetical protein
MENAASFSLNWNCILAQTILRNTLFVFRSRSEKQKKNDPYVNSRRRRGEEKKRTSAPLTQRELESGSKRERKRESTWELMLYYYPSAFQRQFLRSAVNKMRGRKCCRPEYLLPSAATF